MFLGSISDVVQPALGLDCAEFDLELQKLQLHVRGVYIGRQWFSHNFSLSVQECRDAISSLSELCSLMQRRLPDAALAADLKACVEGLSGCIAAVERLQADVANHGTVPFQLRVEHVAAIVLLRSFERLCAAAEESGSKLSLVSTHRSKATGCMHYTDVMHVIDDMQRPFPKNSSGFNSAVTPLYDLIITGRKIFFHGTRSDMALAHLFCCAAVCFLMQQCFPSPSSQTLAAATCDEFLHLCSLLQLHDEKSLLCNIAQSQMSPAPSIDSKDLSWLLPLFSTPRTPKLHACDSDYPEKKLLSFCAGEFFQVRGGVVSAKNGGLQLPAPDTVEKKAKRCIMFAATVALSSESTHPAIKSMDISSTVSSGSSSKTGKRSPEQRDSYFTGRVSELKRIYEVVQAVVLNAPSAPAPLHVAVLGIPGMGKSLLVSQALLEIQRSHLDGAHDVFFMKVIGRGSVSVEESLLVHARNLGSKIGVYADTAPHVALSNLKAHLSCLRFVAIVDDANCEGLQAAAQWIPVSTAPHAILITSQQPAEELSAIELAHGVFEKIALSEFDCSTSV